MRWMLPYWNELISRIGIRLTQTTHTSRHTLSLHLYKRISGKNYEKNKNIIFVSLRLCVNNAEARKCDHHGKPIAC